MSVRFGNDSILSVLEDGTIVEQWEPGARPKLYTSQFRGQPAKAKAWLLWFHDERSGVTNDLVFDHLTGGASDPDERYSRPVADKRKDKRNDR